jgi:hypothetical protein
MTAAANRRRYEADMRADAAQTVPATIAHAHRGRADD